MKNYMLFACLILFLFIFSFSTSATVGPPGNIPPWEGPNIPPDGTCINDTGYFTNATPYNGEHDVEITGKGVQTCINVTVPQGCVVNITFQWLNWSEYFHDWMQWAYLQDWWWDIIDWASEPTYENDSYWYDYSNWSLISHTQDLCAYNTNVTCHTEGDFVTEWFDWRVTGEFTCSGPTYYNTTCYYYFEPEICAVSYIYPPSPNGTACPCCDAICVGVNNELGHPMNITVWGMEDDYGYYNIWKHYENISNGTYCFCMDSITPTTPPHAFAHSHTAQNVTITNNWFNVTFDHGEAEHIMADPATGIVTILLKGHYSAYYWAVVQDYDANPTGHKFAIKVEQNGIDEVDGSYREVTFSKQGYEQHMTGHIHDHFVPGTTLRFKYIGDDTDQAIETDGTWSTDDISFYAYIERIDSEEHFPMQYNQTYYWYVNITDTVTGEQSDSAIFQFKTEDNLSRCPCGIDAVEVVANDTDTIKDDTYIIGIAIVFSMIPIGLIYKRRKR